MYISRYIQKDLTKSLIPGRVNLIMGARRVGKTTLIKQILKDFTGNSIFYNCDDPQIRHTFSSINLEQLKLMLKGKALVVFDEAQRIENIGILLKLITDEIPNMKILVTGSSSLDLANKISEPLTGRKKTFHLYPISFLELWNTYNKDNIKTTSYLDSFMKFGSYPQLFDIQDEKDKIEYLLELTQNYLYKDALEYQNIRNPQQLTNLLTALALQVGQEVSYTELGNIAGLDQKTVTHYINLLEKSYIIFRLPALSRNLRNEIVKSRKIYFYDLGIRNALIRNFNDYKLRTDKGQVWENLLITERMKADAYKRNFKNYYFWRTYDQKEIDYVEEQNGKLSGYEFKWKKDTFTKPKDFLIGYPNSNIELINKNSFLDFVI